MAEWWDDIETPKPARFNRPLATYFQFEFFFMPTYDQSNEAVFNSKAQELREKLRLGSSIFANGAP
jgi:hypothetical protein